MDFKKYLKWQVIENKGTKKQNKHHVKNISREELMRQIRFVADRRKELVFMIQKVSDEELKYWTNFGNISIQMNVTRDKIRVKIKRFDNIILSFNYSRKLEKIYQYNCTEFPLHEPSSPFYYLTMMIITKNYRDSLDNGKIFSYDGEIKTTEKQREEKKTEKKKKLLEVTYEEILESKVQALRHEVMNSVAYIQGKYNELLNIEQKHELQYLKRKAIPSIEDSYEMLSEKNKKRYEKETIKHLIMIKERVKGIEQRIEKQKELKLKRQLKVIENRYDG